MMRVLNALYLSMLLFAFSAFACDKAGEKPGDRGDAGLSDVNEGDSDGSQEGSDEDSQDGDSWDGALSDGGHLDDADDANGGLQDQDGGDGLDADEGGTDGALEGDSTQGDADEFDAEDQDTNQGDAVEDEDLAEGDASQDDCQDLVFDLPNLESSFLYNAISDMSYIILDGGDGEWYTMLYLGPYHDGTGDEASVLLPQAGDEIVLNGGEAPWEEIPYVILTRGDKTWVAVEGRVSLKSIDLEEEVASFAFKDMRFLALDVEDGSGEWVYASLPEPLCVEEASFFAN